MTTAPGTTSGVPIDCAAPPPPARPKPAPAHAPLSMKANFSWTLAGNVAYAACQWAMLVVLAKLGTPEKVGQFVLGLAVRKVVIPVAADSVAALPDCSSRVQTHCVLNRKSSSR